MELLALAESLAAEAAELLRQGLDHVHGVDTKSSLTDMVTASDRASERLIVEGIRAARPDDGILGEEGTADPGTSGVRWVIDPLDGTTNFVYGLPAFAVSIAVEVDGITEVGVVADAAHRETFTAIRGRGAHLDGRPIRCNDATTLATALVGTGFSYDATRRALQGAVVAQVLPVVRDIRRSGSAAVDLCWVAAGRLDAHYEKGLAPWDLGAGALVAAEAGATVGDLDGGPPSGAFTLAAAPALFEPLRALLRTSGAGAA
ncbi:MAG: Inositol-phosphate phosphatase [Actinomycetia bacterium]|nr:Inositol-phosphate phosphatase [Actinomycetes bacterium]